MDPLTWKWPSCMWPWSLFWFIPIRPSSTLCQLPYYKPTETCIITASYKDFFIIIIIGNLNCSHAWLASYVWFFSTHNHQKIYFQKQACNTELCPLLWQSDVDKYSESFFTVFKNISWTIWIPIWFHPMTHVIQKECDPIDLDMWLDLTWLQHWSTNS